MIVRDDERKGIKIVSLQDGQVLRRIPRMHTKSIM